MPLARQPIWIGDNPLNFIKRFFTGMKQDEEPEVSVMDVSPETEEVSPVAEEVSPVAEEVSPVAEEASQPDAEPSFPDVRRVLQVPVISESVFPESSDEILIKAQPSPTGEQCLFQVTRT